MILKGLLFFSVLLPCLAFSDPLTRIRQAKTGDFIVTQQEKTIVAFIVQECTPKSLILEEISLPSYLSKNKSSWGELFQKNCELASSWTLYEIDLGSGSVSTCYSVTQESFLDPHLAVPFLSKLLTLSWSQVPETDQKKIGEANKEGPDQRKLWKPPKIVGGKKLTNSVFENLQAVWSEDESPLSGKTIQLYYDQLTAFPLPYWIEIFHANGTYKIPVIDSGRLSLPRPYLLPKRLPKIENVHVIPNEGLFIKAQVPISYQEIELCANDSFNKVLLPINIEREGQNVHIFVSWKQLCSSLITEHVYFWSLLVNHDDSLTTESIEPYLWTFVH